MRFNLPGHPCDFEIPDEWWIAAGMPGFKPLSAAYRASHGPWRPTITVPLNDLERPLRSPAKPFFDRDRMVKILTGFATGQDIPPIKVIPRQGLFQYRVANGVHRFH